MSWDQDVKLLFGTDKVVHTKVVHTKMDIQYFIFKFLHDQGDQSLDQSADHSSPSYQRSSASLSSPSQESS